MRAIIFAAIATVLACDTATVPQPVYLRSGAPEPGGPWTPCKEDCEGGTCIQTEVGGVCAPPCDGEGGCTAVPISECGDNEPTGLTCTGDVCVLWCDGNGGCYGFAGMVCGKNDHTCAYP